MGNPEKARVPGEVSGRIAGPRPGAGLWFDFRVLEDHRVATRGHVGVHSVQRVQGRGLGAPKPRGGRGSRKLLPPWLRPGPRRLWCRGGWRARFGVVLKVELADLLMATVAKETQLPVTI